MSQLPKLKKDIQQFSDPVRAKHSQRFFKTGKGEYGEGDVFVGLTVPQSRTIAKQYKDLSLPDTQQLLISNIHEHRLIALIILVDRFKKADPIEQKGIYDFYLKNKQHVNNWDLVDTSAPYIVSMYLLDKPKERTILYELAESKSLWDRRISIMGTFAFITKNSEYKDTFAICELMLGDKEDLIHKATGWMLREIGKRISRKQEEEFLKKHYQNMPRTMLRYAIEHFPEKRRQEYLKGTL